MIRPALIAIAVLLSGWAAARAETVDVAIVLAVDASSSVSHGEFGLQMDGIAQALRDGEVARAIAGGPSGRVAFTLVQWSGPGQVRQALDWRAVDSPEGIETLARDVELTPRYFSAGGTAIGQALLYAASQFENLPWPAGRRVIDISGDGRNTDAPAVQGAREDVIAGGIVINGLPILSQEPGIERYYREEVIGGYGAFVEVAADYDAFAAAMRRKLLREIRTDPLISRRPPARVDRPGGLDYFVAAGERRHSGRMR